MRGPTAGGVVATRSIRWLGGALMLNADASRGALKVRVTDANRQPIDGFGYAECKPLAGDDLAHRVTWNGRSLEALKDRVIRLDFLLHDADLYTFRAGAE